MKTLGTYLAGGGMFDAGARNAGLTPVFGVEYDPHPKRTKTSLAIADMYEANFGKHMIRKPVQDIDLADLPSVFWFHSSPVCKNFSIAKNGGIEDNTDIITAQATADYISYHLPKVVTIENVRGYRGSDALILILKCLNENGYSFREDIINMASYGVPQTRIRLIVTAVHNDNTPSLVPPTHEKNPRGMFTLPRWVSWYDAIEDLIPSLPETEFAPWQLARMPDDLKETHKLFLAEGRAGGDRDLQCNGIDRPAMTVTTPTGGNIMRAFIAIPDNTSSNRFIIEIDEPINTQTIWSSKHPPPIAHAMGRVVKMTPEAIARFMSLPKWYKLSGHATVDYTALGNGVPSLFVEKLVTHVLGGLK